MVREYCNVIITVEGTITENNLFIGKDGGTKAEKLFVEKAKDNAPSGFQWDDDIENEALDNGYISFGETTIMLSWPMKIIV